MKIVDELIHRAQATQHGFTDIKHAADELVALHSSEERYQIAQMLFASEVCQARMLSTFIIGQLAAESNENLNFLRSIVSKDESWRVQEILAQAFDQYCADRGYEQALPVIQDWLADPAPNVRRAVTEGLRIWTGRPYFKDHPEIAIRLLSQLRNDESEYVRKSVGNALRDISRKYKDLVKAELAQWDASSKHVKLTYKLASKFLQK